MRPLLLTAALLLLATGAFAQTTTSTVATTSSSTSSTTSTSLPSFPIVKQGSSQAGIIVVMNGQSCTGSLCEGPPFALTGAGPATVYFDCSGACQAKFQCRPDGFAHDILIADSGSLSDGSTAVAITKPCPWIYPQITTCTSGTCKVWATVVQAQGSF